MDSILGCFCLRATTTLVLASARRPRISFSSNLFAAVYLHLPYLMKPTGFARIAYGGPSAALDRSSVLVWLARRKCSYVYMMGHSRHEMIEKRCHNSPYFVRARSNFQQYRLTSLRTALLQHVTSVDHLFGSFKKRRSIAASSRASSESRNVCRSKGYVRAIKLATVTWNQKDVSECAVMRCCCLFRCSHSVTHGILSFYARSSEQQRSRNHSRAVSCTERAEVLPLASPHSAPFPRINFDGL